MKHHLMMSRSLVAAAALALFLTGCSSPSGSSTAEKRETVERMRENTLAEFGRRDAAGRDEVAKAAGYAVFSNVGATFFVVGGSGGYGVVVDGGARERTYMRMGGGELGLGLGVKDFRVIMAFRDESAMKDFIEGRFDFGARADAAGRVGETGGATGTVTNFRERVQIWQFTEQGVMLAATLKGLKFWKDDDLNAK